MVVICFQISIFEPLKTAEYSLATEYQWHAKHLRKRKKSVFNRVGGKH